MATENLKESVNQLDKLKKDAQETMKKGLPFVLASVVIWILILAVTLTSAALAVALKTLDKKAYPKLYKENKK